ncbi:MAG: sigma-70 family RNA polymerase sigma factor [Verrucomicrobiae bacterium]|nr:sigma-70 family RNA polymerase sigma factor [Verrucomicrobiae bacterium]
MGERTDAELLRDYAEHGHEAAFRELVTRYTDLVYSAALRQLESADLACDITQGVFLDLARKARPVSERLAGHNSLAGWLHRSTRYAVLNHLRDTRRRVANERQAMEQLLHNAESSVDWEQIRPALDEALDSLGDEDREALLLRYFKNQNLRTVGAALGVSDDAAQKRVSRAVERLREFFAKRGVTAGASGLAVVISANAVQTAPANLVLTISTAAALTGTTIATTTTITATKALAMTALQKTLVTATVAVLAGAGIYEARQASQLREQVQTLQQQQATLAGQFQQLHSERDDATNRLAALSQDNERLNQNTTELLKLRGRVGLLRRELADANHLLGFSNELARSWTIGQTKWPNDWRNAGLSSPEAAFETYQWAAANSDFQTMRQCLIFDYGTNTESPPQLFANRKVRSELAGISHGLTGGIRLYSVVQWSDDRAGIEIEKMERRGVDAVRPGINGTEDHYFKLSDPAEWDLRKDTVNLLKVDGEWKVITENTPGYVNLTPDDEDSGAVAELMMKMGPNELEQLKTKVPLRTLRAYEALKAKGSP